jgi:hypothetical protein
MSLGVIVGEANQEANEQIDASALTAWNQGGESTGRVPESVAQTLGARG